jgi:hypothetical protein
MRLKPSRSTNTTARSVGRLPRDWTVVEDEAWGSVIALGFEKPIA